MNIELKQIAQSKVRQLGGDVCGVLVRTEDGVMAVSEHGRCTRLDAGVMGPVECAQGGESERQCSHCGGFADYCDDCGYDTKPESAQGGQGAEVIEHTEQNYAPSLKVVVSSLIESARCLGSAQAQPPDPQVIDYWAKQVDHYRAKLYTQPQPAVPEGWRVIRMPELQKALMTGPIIGLDGPRGESVPVVSDSDDRRERLLYQFLDALLSTPTTPQADGWVRCADRVHAKCGGRVIGRMRDGDSVSCEKCGRTGHVLVDDGGIDIDWMPAGQEGA